MNKPLVSVVITTKNSSRTLKKCLESIKKQNYENIELLVVDNNSTDNTKEIAQKYADEVINLGPERSAQRNFGVKKSKGSYVLVHDSDIYFNPNSVKECVEVCEKEGCDAVILAEKSIGEGFWTKVKAFERSFYVGNYYIEAPRFFDKEVFQKLGGYDENLYAGEDWDLMVRLREGGYKIGRIHSLLEHDEGRLSFFGSSKKKKYYSKNFFEVYAKKNPEYFKKQMSFFVRFPPKKILQKASVHPILFLSMILMKGVEYLETKKS
ncbi:MAG TPA: glycosyltransferase [bacterium]|nr:glycosyltransferase [bacterium]